MSEYTRMVVLENDHLKKAKESAGGKEVCIRNFEEFVMLSL